MPRWLVRLLVPFTASLALVAPASAATTIRVTEALLLDDNSAVRLTVEYSCDQIGMYDVAALAVNVYQGKYPHPNYIEGFGTYGEIGGSTLVCNGQLQEQSLLVEPTQFFADRTFRPGPAIVRVAIIVCSPVAPETYQCEQIGSIETRIRLPR
jgi:hypothetical protein